MIILVVESRQLRQCCWSWLPIETASLRLQTSQSCKVGESEGARSAV